MSVIANMSEPERQSWITLIADGFVFVWFWKTMTSGWSLTPHEMSPGQLGQIYLSLVIITIIYHAVIAGFFEFRKRGGGGIEQDERDVLISAMGSKLGYSVLQIGVGVILVAAVINYAYGADVVPFLYIETPVQFLFAITFISYAADLVRHVAILLRYQAS